GKFALSLHPEKTRLIEFGRFAAERRKRRGLGKPETFNFLGFTFICGKTRSGKFQIKRKTRSLQEKVYRMSDVLTPQKEASWQIMDRATAQRQSLLAAGYLPIPINGKAPIMPEWQRQKPTAGDVDKWPQLYPTAAILGQMVTVKEDGVEHRVTAAQ